MATTANEHIDLTPFIRRDKLHHLADAARNLARVADAGQSDDLIASQLALTVRRLAGAIDVRPGCEDVSAAIDSLGQQIQFAAKGLRPEGMDEQWR